MNDHEAAGVLAVLNAAWPNQDLPDQTVDLWLSLLADLHVDDAKAAAAHIVRHDQWFPPIARFLEQASAAKRARQIREAEHRGLPEAADWTLPPSELTEAAREILAQRESTQHDHRGPDPCPACGGRAAPAIGRQPITMDRSVQPVDSSQEPA